MSCVLYVYKSRGPSFRVCTWYCSFRAAPEGTVKCGADNGGRGSAAAVSTLLPRLSARTSSGRRDGPVLGVGGMRGRGRTRGNTSSHTTQHPRTERSLRVVRPWRSQPAGAPLVQTEGLVSAVSPGCGSTNANVRENGGIRDRRGWAVVRPAGPGAG